MPEFGAFKKIIAGGTGQLVNSPFIKLTMKNYLVLVLVSLSFSLSAQESPFNPAAVFPARHDFDTGDTLRIMTWNVEHLIDAYNDPYVNNKREDEGSIDPEKLARVAEVLELAEADIVVLQEAESANAVELMRDSFFPDLGYRYLADARSRDWYQNVVILSKLPLGKIVSYGNVHTPVAFEEDGETKYQTQNYINTRMWTAQVIVNPNYGLYLSGAHLKAGGGNRNRAMRLGQIDYLKGELAQILEREPKADLIVLGDLNSYRNGPEIARFLSEVPAGLAFQDPLAPEVNTHPADAPKKRLDYILYNANLKGQVWEGNCQVFSPFDHTEMRRISDHLPVVMDMVLD